MIHSKSSEAGRAAAQEPSPKTLVRLPKPAEREGAKVTHGTGFSEILVVYVSGQWRAYSGVCPHLGGPMLAAPIAGTTITCPWHEYVFDLRNGACLTVPGEKWTHSSGPKRACKEPAHLRLKEYPVVVENGELVVTVPTGRMQGTT